MNNKSIFFLFRGLMLIFAITGSPIAQANSVNVVYINGIQNTLEDAQKTVIKINNRLNESPNHTGLAKKSFVVSLVWNPIGWFWFADGQWDLLQDKMELFLLKTAEEIFADDFKKIVSPFNAPKTIDKAAALNVTIWFDQMAQGRTSLETNNQITDADMRSTKVAVIELADRVKELGSAIVIAHSQGNLLANLAYAKLAASFGDDLFQMMRVVNVANTSEFSVNNLSFTHAGDAALFSTATSIIAPDNSLETLALNEQWTRTTPKCANLMCLFTIAPATFSAQNDIDGQDKLGVDILLDHSIYETYLSDAIVETNGNTPHIKFAANKHQFIDRFEDFVYAAADSLLTNTSLNDTGITSSQCYMAGRSGLVDCSSAEAIALSNTQDGMIGGSFSFSAVEGGCVQDNVTGLMWERKAINGGLRDWNKLYTNYGDNRAGDASAYPAAVNATNLCGYADWRLPRPDELLSIVNYGSLMPSIDVVWFPDTHSSFYWSGSIGDYIFYPPAAIYFGEGTVSSAAGPSSLEFYVRLVRGGR